MTEIDILDDFGDITDSPDGYRDAIDEIADDIED